MYVCVAHVCRSLGECPGERIISLGLELQRLVSYLVSTGASGRAESALALTTPVFLKENLPFSWPRTGPIGLREDGEKWRNQRFRQPKSIYIKKELQRSVYADRAENGCVEARE